MRKVYPQKVLAAAESRQIRRPQLSGANQEPFWTVPRNARKLQRIGAVAQLGERCVRNAEVEGSTPFRSTSQDSLAVAHWLRPIFHWATLHPGSWILSD